MNTVNVRENGDYIYVSCPINENFRVNIKNIGGRWDPVKKEWYVRREFREELRGLLISCYGEDGYGQSSDYVDVKITFPEMYVAGETLLFGGRVIARAFGRDSGARVGDGCAILAGGLSSGGSRKNFGVVVKAGTVLKVVKFPETLVKDAIEEFCNRYGRNITFEVEENALHGSDNAEKRDLTAYVESLKNLIDANVLDDKTEHYAHEIMDYLNRLTGGQQ
jgi:hypothetical protein